MPGSRPTSRQRQQPFLLRPATSGAAAGSKQLLAGATLSGAAGEGKAIATATQKRRAPAQQAQQKMSASGARGAKQGGKDSGLGKLGALGKRRRAQPGSAQGPPEAAAAEAVAASARHVTWDKSPQA